MTGVKRDHTGSRKAADSSKEVTVRNAYTSMFEGFREELDEHHDRRQKIIKVSKDVTALSKKMCEVSLPLLQQSCMLTWFCSIFSLQR
jgi:hypothetical protein